MANLPISGLPGGSPADVNLLVQEVPGVATQKITLTQVKTYLNGAYLQIANNLSDVASVSTAVTNLGATSANTASALVRRDASGNFSMGTLTAVGATISMGASGSSAFSVTGTNPACNIGANFNVAQATTSAAFFSGTVNGDCILRNSNSSFSIYIGVGGSTAQVQIANTVVNFKVNPTIATSTNPTITFGTNGLIAQPTANAQFFTNGLTGDFSIRQSSLTNVLRLGVANGSQASGLDISSTHITTNLATTINGAFDVVGANATFNQSITVGINATIVGNSSSGTATVTGLATVGSLIFSGISQTALSYYEEDITGSTNISMSTPAGGANQNLPVKFTRIGKIVTMQSAGLSVTSTSAAKFVAAAGQIPSKFRPSSNLAYIDDVGDNSLAVIGLISIGSDGSMTVGVGAANANFTNTGNASILSFSLTYLTS